MSIFWVLLSLVFVFITQRQITVELSRLIRRFGGGQRAMIYLWSLIFLPGTIVHEVSHFLAAAFTGARTGKIEIFPEFIDEIIDEKEDRHVRLGYVQVQAMNPIQGFVVGIAPFISGIILTVWLASLLNQSYVNGEYVLMAFEAYLFFTVVNSFFPSWADIKQTLPLIVIMVFVGLALWLLNIQINIDPQSPIWDLIDTLSNALVISVGINILIYCLLFLLNKITKRRK